MQLAIEVTEENCKIIEEIAFAVMPALDYYIRGQAPAGIQKPLVFKEYWIPDKDLGNDE